MRSATPDTLKIQPRDLKFNRETEAPARWWVANDPVATAFYNSMSANLPVGEAFVIDSVRHFREQADPKLKEQIVAFIRQEGHHSREHIAFNVLIKRSGFDLDPIDASVRKLIADTKRLPPVARLAIAVAIEHLTTIMSYLLLTDPRHMLNSDPEVTRLYQWHAMEELEHKTVCFDTYLAATRDMSAVKRWVLRSTVMIQCTRKFWAANLRNMAGLFRQDGINKPRTWLRVLHFLLVKPGLMRQSFLPYFQFFRPGFHPWMRDDRELIAEWEKRFSAGAPVA